MKLLLLSLLLGISLCASSQTVFRVNGDTVKIEKGELEVQNSSKNVNGYLFNVAGGRTIFQRLGNNIQFAAGAPGFPAVGDSVYINQDFAGQAIKVWRNGLLQYQSSFDGVGIDSISGKIVFHPALVSGDRIYIESIYALDVSVNDNNAELPTGTRSLGKLYAGVFDNGDNTYTLRWTTNPKTLFLSPRVLGIGASTLAGHGLTYPDRLPDKISAWLTNNTYSPLWRNLAVFGYTSANLLPVIDGGSPGTNIDSALNADPDFIFLALASNDPSAGISTNQSILNYKKIDSLAKLRGVPIFFSTTQPRSNYNAAQQTMLKNMADSIRKLWPDRYVEAFLDVVDKSAPTDAAILPQYNNGDDVHLNGAGVQFIADHLIDRWISYFKFVKGVKRFTIDTSADRTNWTQLDNITDRDIVKKSYARVNKLPLYFRVRSEFLDGSFSDYSNTVKLEEVLTPPLPPVFDHRILIDLGGDSVFTINGSGLKDGKPAPSPDAQGKIWNNWYGKGGVTGFADSAAIGSLRTAAGDPTKINMIMLGTPQGSFGTTATKSLNFNGFSTTGVDDYPMQALYDNVYFYGGGTPKPVIVLRIKGLSRNNTYYIKLWGARIDNETAPRTLEVKLGTTDWVASQTMNTRYAVGSTPEYDRVIMFNNITGKDSIDLDIRVANGSTFGHLSLIDIGIMGSLPVVPKVDLRDTSTTLNSIRLTPNIITAGATISSYQWTQLSGPNTAIIGTPNSANTTISSLTNGIFTFRLSALTNEGLTISDEAVIKVYPDNEGRKTLRVNFSNTKVQDIPGWLNVYGPVTDNYITVTDNSTNWTVDNVSGSHTVWSPLAVNGSNVDGYNTGNNSGVIPDIALQSYWFNYSVTYSTGKYNLVLSGLDPTKTYTLKLYASRNSSAGAPKYGAWHVNDGPQLLQNALDNATNETIVNDVSPDAEGKIKIAVYPAGGIYGSASFINALILQEN